MSFSSDNLLLLGEDIRCHKEVTVQPILCRILELFAVETYGAVYVLLFRLSS
jgi:hypothetical protein